MTIPIFQADAFTSKLFGGNPAAICPLAEWLPDEVMQKIAVENNLAETAFFVKTGKGYLLRWFTPNMKLTCAAMPHWRRHISCLPNWDIQAIPSISRR